MVGSGGFRTEISDSRRIEAFFYYGLRQKDVNRLRAVRDKKEESLKCWQPSKCYPPYQSVSFDLGIYLSTVINDYVEFVELTEKKREFSFFLTRDTIDSILAGNPVMGNFQYDGILYTTTLFTMRSEKQNTFERLTELENLPVRLLRGSATKPISPENN